MFFISSKSGANKSTQRRKCTLHNKPQCDFALIIVLIAHHWRVCSPICARFQLIHPFSPWRQQLSSHMLATYRLKRSWQSTDLFLHWITLDRTQIEKHMLGLSWDLEKLCKAFNLLDVCTGSVDTYDSSLASFQTLGLLPPLTQGTENTCKQLILMMRMVEAELLSSVICALESEKFFQHRQWFHKPESFSIL